MISIGARRLATAAMRGKTTSMSIGSQLKNCTSSSTLAFHGHNFSTNPQQEEEKVLFMPPNLRIDYRSSASPFAGLEKISPAVSESESESESKDDEVQELGPDDLSLDSQEDDEDDDDEDDDEDEGTYYSLANQPEPIYVIPLHLRLNAQIIDFASNAEAGTIHLSEDVFGQNPIRTDILHRCVVYQRNKKRGKRNGGARTKTISEVSGSGKKMRNQKGGGVARAGHKRPAHWKGGAKAHGPKGSVQNYETKLNKKVRKLGLKMALSQKLKEGNLILVNTFSNVGTYKTKIIAQTLQKLAGIGGKEGTSAYIVDHVVDDVDEESDEVVVTSLDGCDINLKVGSENIFRTKVVNQQTVNVYDVLKHEKLIISLSALKQLEQRYGDL
jgi:large subunit ribosomal protein L4